MSLASPPYSDNHSLTDSSNQPCIQPATRSLLASTWQVLEQPPPPSLREILAAYKARGDGDRDMLLAMLNAKSAEDQRLASVASLHRTMLELKQHDAPSPNPQQHHLQIPKSEHSSFVPLSPHVPPPPPTSSTVSPHIYQTQSPTIASPRVTLPSIRDRPVSLSAMEGHPSATSESKRKRARVAPAQYASSSSGRQDQYHLQRHHQDPADVYHAPSTASSMRDFPPSPDASNSQRSMSAESSRAHAHAQAQRGAMAIGSLLSGPASKSNGAARDRDHDMDGDESWNHSSHSGSERNSSTRPNRSSYSGSRRRRASSDSD